MLRTLSLSIILGVSLYATHTAQAASLFFVPGESTIRTGNDISVDIKIDSEGVGINATQATIRFPKETLSVKSIDKTDSTFNFWLEEPTFSNETGIITFIGGTPYGVSGSAIQVFHITFTSKGSGAAPVTFVDAAITASDGSGTNVLSKTVDASFTVSPTATATTPVVVVPSPVQITREPEPAVGLPSRPVVSVPLYATQEDWYNHINIFTANWKLPLDISGVATAINKQPNYVPNESSEGLFDNKSFSALTDGTWYLHVRFRNNIGWGPTAHYRIAIDTKAPLPFEMTSSEGGPSDNPTPILSFKASDALSGLKEYSIKIDQKEWTAVPIQDFKGSYELPPQAPGEHRITVRAVDFAGNSIENSLDYQILPLPAPVFTFVTNKIFTEDASGLSVKGTGLPLTEMILTLKRGEIVIASNSIHVDTNGNWEFTFGDPLRKGTYVVIAQNKDARGAVSLEVSSPEISVSGKYTNAIIVTIIALTVILFVGFWFYEKRRKRTHLRIDVAESDTTKVFKMIEDDIEKLKKSQTTPTTADDEFALAKMEANIKKMGTYVKEEIKKAKE